MHDKGFTESESVGQKAVFNMFKTKPHSTSTPRSFSLSTISFRIVLGCLALLMCSPLTWAVTVTSGPTLTLDPNGNTPLAGVIHLKTDLPARITLEVSDGNENRTIEFAEFRTDFSLPLLGLKPERKYTVEVKVTDQNKRQSIVAPVLKAMTGPLPDDFPEINVLVSEPALMEPGYTMMARFIRASGDTEITLAGFSTGLTKEKLSDWACQAMNWAMECATDPDTTYTIIVDDSGDVVWYSTLGDITNYQLEDGSLLYRSKNDIVIIDMLGNVIRRVTMEDPGTGLTHDVFPTADLTYLSITIKQATIQDFPTSVTDPNSARKPAQVEDNPIVEFDRDGKLLHIWPLIDMLDRNRIAYHSLIKRPLGYDWAHGNAVIHDPRDDSILISLRHQDAVVKFSRSTGDLIWILGPHNNWSPEFQQYLLKPVGEPFEWQYHQHSPTVTPSGSILLFDNGNFRASPFDGKAKIPDSQNYSRAVEYAIDELKMEVRQIWEYGEHIDEPLFAGHISDANWMPATGNVLVTFGGTSFTGGKPVSDLGLGEIATRIIEVTHDTPAKKVFDMLVFDPETDARLQVFRSERIPDLYPLDSDSDGIPDYKDDNKLVPNGPLIPGDAATNQLDSDGDGTGDRCDNGNAGLNVSAEGMAESNPATRHGAVIQGQHSP
jgi:arylsulfate sulfotransferase